MAFSNSFEFELFWDIEQHNKALNLDVSCRNSRPDGGSFRLQMRQGVGYYTLDKQMSPQAHESTLGPG